MNRAGSDDRTAADWLQPPEEETGLKPYLVTLRQRAWIVVVAVLIATGIAIAYVTTTTKTYTAQANVLVTPVSATDTPLVGLPGVIPASTDPTRDVETASELVTNIDVAKRVQRSLNSSASPSGLLDKVSATPVGSSNVVAISGSASSPTLARDIANAFAYQSIAYQTAQLHAAIDRILPRLEARIGGGRTSGSPINALQSLRSGPTPSMSIETKADTPNGPSSPRTTLSVAGAGLAGLVLGIGAAFAAQSLDPRLRREEQLRRLYRLPILARVPRDYHARRRVASILGAVPHPVRPLRGRAQNSRRARTGTGQRGTLPLAPAELSPPTQEAYRTLRGTLAALRRTSRSGSRTRSLSILVTGCSPGEGKTTTAINLASSLSMAGNDVILIEADLRQPAIGAAVEVPPHPGVVSVIVEDVSLDDALVTSPILNPKLRFLLADYEGGWSGELFGLPAAREMIRKAVSQADYVILDSPPLADVADALPLAEYVDDVLLVVGIGKTHLGKLGQVCELLAESRIKPAGFAVVGTRRPSRSDYLYAAAGQRARRDGEPERGRLVGTPGASS